ncbi:MAG: O-antigen ligase family protein [Henriciella sp.]
MRRRITRSLQKHGLTAILFAYLTLCVVMGGAGREGLYWHGLVQGIAALGLAALVITWPARVKLGDARTPLFILIAIAGIGLLQLIPLPSGVWSALPGRALVADGYESLGQTLPSRPISLDVEATLITLGYVITPIFVLALSARIGMRRLQSSVPWFLAILGVTSVIYGLFQVFDGRDSLLYLYEFTSRGLPVGFFSNVNHQASLLLMILPFAFFLLSELGQDWQGGDSNVAVAIVIVAMIFMLLVGVFGAGSVGGYAILAPIAALSFLASRKSDKSGMRRSTQLGIMGAFLIGAILVGSSPVLEGIGVTSFSDGEGSRYNIWMITIEAIREHWLTGSGLGTYESVIPLYENPETVTATFVAKAHNDYLQILMEGGILGLILLVFAFIWFGQVFLKLWSKKRSGSTGSLRKFAFVALVAILLHSIVDYPARTPAIAAMVGLCLALVAIPESRGARAKPKSSDNEKRIVL